MRTITETFVAGVAKEYGIPGTRLEILSAPGTVTVSLRDANNVEITNGLATNLDPGSYMVPDGGFKRFSITSSDNGDIKFLVSYGEGGTRSVAGTVAVSGTVDIEGVVSVVDGGKSRTTVNTAFIGYGHAAAVAAQYSQIQLWNPAGSGKNLFVEQINFWSSGTLSDSVYFRNSVAALPTAGAAPTSKKLDGAAGVGLMKTTNNVAMQGTHVMAVDGTSKLFKFTEPVQIPPGYGLIVANNKVNEALGVAYEFFEESV